MKEVMYSEDQVVEKILRWAADEHIGEKKTMKLLNKFMTVNGFRNHIEKAKLLGIKFEVN